MPTSEEIVCHYESDPGANPWVAGAPPVDTLVLVPYDPCWPDLFGEVAGELRGALGSTVLNVEHVGSTAVRGLAAKPVLDVDLTVADPSDEATYAPPVEALGYVLTIREPAWHQHRCFRHEVPRVNLHVFGPDSPELIRHRLLRDWLRAHPDDRVRYEDAKREAAQGAIDVADYNARKQPVIREIYGRVFTAAGLFAP